MSVRSARPHWLVIREVHPTPRTSPITTVGSCCGRLRRAQETRARAVLRRVARLRSQVGTQMCYQCHTEAKQVGYRARWLGVKNGDMGIALRTLGLRETSVSDKAVYDTGHYAVNLPNGWLVVIGDGRDAMETVQPEHARELSVGTESLHFYCDDTPMCASISAYRDGKEVWSLTHDRDNNAEMPMIEGTPVTVVGDVVTRVQRQQEEAGPDGADFVYEAAPEIGLAITGFRHDKTLGDGDVLPIHVLKPGSE
jgi:hypothetical protein